MISVIIPVYNEEKVIRETIKEIKKVLKDNNLTKESEIIVVNDGSTDNTEKEALKEKVKVITNPHNNGYGYSIKRGIMAAKNDIIVTTDADLTYPFEYLKEMLEAKEKGFDLIVGARTNKTYREHLFKRLLRIILKKFVEFITEKKIKDVNSGFRVFDKKTVIKYFPRLCDTFSFSTSQTLAYIMDSLFVSYVDITYNKRHGKTKVKLFRDSVKALRYIFETSIYYNPLKTFTLISVLCVVLAIIGFFFSHFMHINAGYILGIGGLLVSIINFSLGLLAVLLKQIMNK